MTKSVLLVLTNHGVVEGTDVATGWYLPECAHPYFRFKDANYDISFCSVSGGDTTVSPSSLDMTDEENKSFWENAETKSLTENTKPLSDFDGSKFDCVFFVGGFGTMWDFPDNEHVQRVAREVYERGGVVGAVCHGPIALANVRLSNGSLLVEGKGCTAFCNEEEAQAGMESHLPQREGGKSCEDILAARGGRFSKGAAWSNHVVSDERVVTGQNPMSARSAAEACIAALA
mmetsp:Transcript_9312/g.14027  ORF Transcript_9312/g.14027 Transcript_9312/m.14027 type:complete len:231 (+) Transcript_9312:77-769(+)|eukprot:CAMPEP_0185024416 /NCGR_PEP_ID=MMETSP1103-20130426/7477_1 /TAXON_ID=36769 /ORGANISM="Paraphysomonas bandaiensis, Strain Caron Lab Isolate" /LENGTH=230 /DNA_ID=CAMNT_0027557377 /DNA_START=55 /DNA_END=747 /DNA_ORIENTATION=+